MKKMIVFIILLSGILFSVSAETIQPRDSNVYYGNVGGYGYSVNVYCSGYETGTITSYELAEGIKYSYNEAFFGTQGRSTSAVGYGGERAEAIQGFLEMPEYAEGLGRVTLNNGDYVESGTLTANNDYLD